MLSLNLSLQVFSLWMTALLGTPLHLSCLKNPMNWSEIHEWQPGPWLRICYWWFSRPWIAHSTGLLMGMKPHPTTWATCNLAFLLRLAAKKRFEDVASYRQTSSEMETSRERMEKVSSPWPLMFLMFGGVAWWGGCCVFDRQLGGYLGHGQITSNLHLHRAARSCIKAIDTKRV